MSGIKTKSYEGKQAFFCGCLPTGTLSWREPTLLLVFDIRSFLNDSIKQSAHIIRVLLQLLQEKNGQPSDRTLFVTGN